MAFRVRCVRGLAASVAGAAFSLAACSEEVIDPLPEEVDSYVGAIDGSDAVFAVTATEREVVLYVCGGASSLERHSRWYRGQRSAGAGAVPSEPEQALLSADDGSTAVVHFTSHPELGERLEGEVVESDGTRLELAASLSDPDTLAGLYGAVDAGCRTGVVVQHGSAADEPVVQGTWCSKEGIFAQVTPIAPVESSAQGFEVMVTANRRVQARQLLVHSINPADF